MAAIISLDSVKRRPPPRAAKGRPAQTATILMFTGVRTEPRPEESGVATTSLQTENDGGS